MFHTNVFVFLADNRAKKRRKAQTKDFSVFNQPDEQNRTRLSPQLALATFQYLSTSKAMKIFI